MIAINCLIVSWNNDWQVSDKYFVFLKYKIQSCILYLKYFMNKVSKQASSSLILSGWQTATRQRIWDIKENVNKCILYLCMKYLHSTCRH